MSKNEETVLSLQPQPNLHLDLGSASDARSFISFQVSPSSALASTSSISLSSPQPGIPPAINKARGEVKKLLAHLLSQLKARPAAPSIYDNINTDSTRREFHRLGEVVETVKGAVRFKSPKELVNLNDRPEDEDDAVDAEEVYSTNVTHNLMSQLRDVLITSAKQGLHIFESTESEEPTSSIRRLRSSRQFSQRSRASSFGGSSQPPNLLIESIDVLASVISEDCRFRTSSPRLFCPPYSLQSVSLDVAQCLIKAHSHDPKILSRIGFAVIPAFSTFNSSLHARLLAFFEDGIIRGTLTDLRSLQGFAPQFNKDVNEEDNPIKTPVVAIQVEKAVDDSPAHLGSQGWVRWNNHASPRSSNLLSSVAPSQPLSIYYLSSLIPPLLVAVLDAIDPFEQDISDIPMFYRLQTLIRTIVSMKRDAYLDFLEVVAYHSPQTRRKALAVLATFWPRALGHVVIGKSLPLISYPDSLPDQTPSTKLLYTNPPRDHPYAHEFVPWRFFLKDASVALDYGIIRNTCQSCYGAISGFGLLCPFCFTSVHLNCYDAPDGMFQGQYPVSSGPDSKQCFVSFSNTLPWRKDMEPEIIMKAQHTFRTANLFTLALCMVCRKPLWGYVKQGLKCSLCKQFVHLSCVSSSAHTFPSCADFSLSESHVVIDKVTLRKTFVDYYKEILIDEKELLTKTYEDISVFYSVLWAQLCIFENGIAYKSIVTKGRRHLDDFELQHFVHLYETFLSSRRLAMSDNVQEYYDLNKNLQVTEHSILFDWPFLTNVVSVIKSSLPTHPLATSNFLTVSEREMDDLLDIPSHPYELVPLSQMRSALGFEFQVYSDSAAQYMLSHIGLVGFFDRTDNKDGLFDSPAPSQVLCSFPLPSGLDLSTSVETMVVAIESCLRDIDVAVNEHGFLLLVRRFWPTGAASEYALTRLTKIVLSWVLAEDDRLVIIARDHVARNLNLPGVRSPYDIPPWPSSSRHGNNKGIHGGGEYVLCRKLLLIRHALPWLSAVHSLDRELYTTCLYEYCEEVYDMSESSRVFGVPQVPDADFEGNIEAAISRCDVVLRSITKLSQSNVVMSTFETLLTRWFDSVASSPIPRNSCIFKSLSRLFGHETDASHRASTLNDSLFVIPDSLQINPWSILDKVASEDLQGFERCLSWLHVMAHSAVEIPIMTLKRIFELTGKVHASFSMVVSLLESTMTFVWPKAFGSSGLDSVIIETIKVWENELVRRMRFPEESEAIHEFLRYSLITCLLEYGCERQAMVSLGLISSGELANMPQRRRVPRASVPSVIIIDPRLVTILSRFVNDGPDSVCVLIAKFLNTLVSESALLETHEIDEFILINGDALSQCAWRFYDVTSQELSDIRASFLVRILAVDPQPFDALLHEIFQTGTNWQVRYFAVTRLFRIVLDVTSPSFGVEGRQWKSNVADVINHFLKPLWMDDREEVRLAVYSSAQTLLPAHLHAISSFWTEVMTMSPISDRARLSAFLVQLHPHFPSWQLLPWDTIVEVLLDDDFVQHNNKGGDAYVAIQNPAIHEYSSHPQGQVNGSHRSDPDAETLQVSMTLLSLKMIADGIPIDVLHVLKVKFILTKILGFKSTFFFLSAGGQAYHVQIGSLDGFNQLSYPFAGPLMRIIDAPHVLSLSPSAMGVSWNDLPVTGLVGDVFMDIVSRLWEKTDNVQKLPYDVLRALLESMLLAVVKHDLNSPVLRHLDEVVCEAVKSVTNLVLSESSYDLRHLCLSVMQAFMREYPVLGLRILGHQVTVLTRLAVSLHFSAEDSLMLQTTEFLEDAFERYEVTGLFWLLSKQGRLSDDFFLVLRMVVNGPNSAVKTPIKVLGDSIVRDTLSTVAANTTDPAVPDALHNLEKYVAICHHHPYSDNLIHHIGLRLTAIARQIMDNTSFNVNRAHAFDPNPLLSMTATIMQHHKEQSLDLVSHTETLLHVALSKFGVHAETLNGLLRVISTTYQDSKQAEVASTESPANHVIASVLEMLSDSLTGKIRALPSTTTAMLEATISLHKDDSTFMPISALYRVGVDAVSYLAHPVYRETYSHAEFAASLAAAKLFLQISGQDAAFFSQTLVGDSRVLTPVRVWNLVTLTSLSGAETYASSNLLAILPSFVAAYVTSLKEPLSGIMNDSTASNVNHALASVKLWMLIAHRARSTATEINYPGSYADERMIWDQLWPSFERLLALSQTESPYGEMPPLSSFIVGCVSDLILFLRQSRSVVALDTYFHVHMLNKLLVSSRRDSVGSKFTRTLREISEPSGDHTFDMLVSQVASDVFAAEKLQAIETYKTDKRREVTDRRRIDARELRATS